METFLQNIRMFQILTFLLACSVGLAPGMDRERFIVPNVVKALGSQCKDRGPFAGACASQNVGSKHASGFRCDYLICAKRVPGPVLQYEAVRTGPPLDGTECRKDHVCLRGKCEYAGPMEIPTQEGQGPSLKCLERVIHRGPPVPPRKRKL